MLARVTGVAVWGTILAFCLIILIPFVLIEWIFKGAKLARRERGEYEADLAQRMRDAGVER